MRVPISWLRDYVDFDLPAERLAERLTLLGMEVQSITTVGGDWTSVVVGELLTVAPHPGADRLSLTTVRVSSADAPLSIVCGATNIAVGQLVPVALPGATLPGGRRITVTSIQGAESQGMLCSGAELGLTSDADGIMILSEGPGGDGLPGLALGRPLVEVVGDTVLDIDVKPNRGDALSLIGLAREVAAISGTPLRWPQIEVPESGDATDDHLWVEIADRHLCPRFVGRYVDNLRVGPSPLQVQLRLAAAGMRPISNAVDASNYVMLEMGKPIHVFDAAAVTGGVIVVRSAKEGEQLETLDHVVRTLTPDTLVIADSQGPIGIAGVMGGAQSEVGPATSAAIIESAIFDPGSIRRTAQRYALRSEASARFEKGQESRLARVGADRTAELLAEWAGARVAIGAVDTNPEEEPPRRVMFRPARIGRLLGDEVGAADARAALERVGIVTEHARSDDSLVIAPGDSLEIPESALVAVVPTHRRDIVIEADVAEEIARIRGYDRVPSLLPSTRMPGQRADPRRLTDTVRDLLSGRGLNEVVTNGLIGPEDHARLGYPAEDGATIRVENPVTIDHSELRRSLLPGLLAVLGRNERQRRSDVAIFEIGAVHERDAAVPRQTEMLGVLLAGELRPASWVEPGRSATLHDVKGLVEMLASRLHVGRVEYRPASLREGVEHPGRTAEAFVESEGMRADIGRIGEIDPRLLAAFEVRAERVPFALIEMAALGRLSKPVEVRRLDHLPIVERDLAVVVSRDRPAADVERVIRVNGGPHLVRVALFDRYSGQPLASNEVSLAYRLSFQPDDEPLEEKALDEWIEQIGRSVSAELGGRIRDGAPADAAPDA
jgi:phenylalanyl-tRNA synthetase beta chain